MSYEKSAYATALPPTTPTFYVNYKEPFTLVKDGYGAMGVLSTTADRDYVQCHICGYLFQNLGAHVRLHKLSAAQYKKEFGLSRKAALIGETVREILIKRYHNKILSSDENHAKAANALKDYWLKVKSGEIGREMRKDWSLERHNQSNNCPEQLLEKIRLLGKELGRVPTTKEWIQNTGHGHEVLKTAFGSYKKAIELAGYEPNKHWRDRGPLVTRGVLLEMMKIFYRRHGRVPRSSDFKRGLLPDQRYVYYYFRSMAEARAAAGLPALKRVGGGVTSRFEEVS